MPRVGAASKAFSDARSAITGRIVDSYTNIQSVKLFAHTRTEEAYAGEAIEHARKTFMAQMRIITLMDLGLTLINGFLIVAVIGYAIVLWQQGTATIGTVAAASALTLRLNAMTGWIMWSLSSLFQNVGVIREGMETIAQPIAAHRRAGRARRSRSPAARSCSTASATTTAAAPAACARSSLTIRPGEKVGLVGRSGAGKSTLVNLILRFFDTEGGAIRIDGQDMRGVTQDSLRRQIGMVTQDPSLLHRSVARQHPLRPARGVGGRDGRGRAARRGARLHPRARGHERPRAATTPMSASAASSSRAASASASRWRG